MSQFTDEPAKLPHIGEQLPHLKERRRRTGRIKIQAGLTFSGRQISMSRRSAVASDARKTLVGLWRTWRITRSSLAGTRHCVKWLLVFLRKFTQSTPTSLHYNSRKKEGKRLHLFKKLFPSVSKFDYLGEIP